MKELFVSDDGRNLFFGIYESGYIQIIGRISDEKAIFTGSYGKIENLFRYFMDIITRPFRLNDWNIEKYETMIIFRKNTPIAITEKNFSSELFETFNLKITGGGGCDFSVERGSDFHSIENYIYHGCSVGDLPQEHVVFNL